MFNTPNNFAELVGQLLGILSLAIPLIFSLTLLVIVWKIVDTWIINVGAGEKGNAKKVEEGKQYVVVGVIVLVIMSGIWGILSILRASLFGS